MTAVISFPRLSRALPLGRILLLAATSSLLIFSGTSCSLLIGQPPPGPDGPPPPKAPKDAFWHGEGVSGPRKIVIDLSAQRIRYFKGGQLVGMSPISSGKEGAGTRAGNFSIIQKDLNHRSTHYGAFVDKDNMIVVGDVDARKDKAPPGTRFLGASMKYFMRVTGAIGMHEGYLPGYPASHGCIRLPTKMAEIFYNETPLGTPVQIVGHASNAGPQEEIPVGEHVVAGVPPAPAAPAVPAPKPMTRQERIEDAQARAAMGVYPSGYVPTLPPRFLQRPRPGTTYAAPGQTQYFDMR